MAVNLTCLLLGDSGVGKSSLIRAFSANREACIRQEVELIDPASRTRLILHIEEGKRLRDLIHRLSCAIVVYDVKKLQSFQRAKTDYIPESLSLLSKGQTFGMLVGTHLDERKTRVVDLEEAEESASNCGFLHLEVSCPSRKNIDLLLRLIRIQAMHILNQYPTLKSTISNRTEEMALSELTVLVPVLTITVLLTPEKSVSVDVYQTDSALEVAHRALSGITENLQAVLALSDCIISSTTDYCRKLKQGKDTEPGCGKPMFKVTVNLGDQSGDLVVREGDELLTLASEFAQANNLPPEIETYVSTLLQDAFYKYQSLRSI